MLSNIWKHPKTTITGVLLGVAQFAPVLLKYGITMGTFHGAPALALISGVATTALGMFAQDPGATAPGATPSSSVSKVGALMLCALLLPLPCVEGCSGTSVAQDIVNWTPALQSAVATVDSSASLIAPADAAIFTAGTAGFDAASNLLVAQAKAYLANPNATTLQQLQAQVVTLQQQVNAALLQAAGIKDSASQTHAITSIQAVATIVTAILALVTQVSSKAQVAAMARRVVIPTAAVPEDLNLSARILADHYREPVSAAYVQAYNAGIELSMQGF